MRAEVKTNRLNERLHRWGAPRKSTRLALKPCRWMAWGGFVSTLVWCNPAARGFRIRALGRFWCWQIWRRALNGSIELELGYGGKLWMPPWSSLAGVVAATNTHEPGEQAFLWHFLRPGDGVVDVGANLGLYTIPAAVKGAYVAAFEPVDMARAVLAYNIRINAVDSQVSVLPFALGDHEDVVEITTDLESSNRVLDREEHYGSSTSVAMRTFDATVDEFSAWFDLHGCRLLKIDAEGLDCSVLRGAIKSITRWSPVMIVEAWAGGKEIRSLLSESGYRVYLYRFEDRTLSEYPEEWEGDGNLIAVPDVLLEEVTERLRSGPDWNLGLPRARWLRTAAVAGAGSINAAGPG